MLISLLVITAPPPDLDPAVATMSSNLGTTVADHRRCVRKVLIVVF